MNTDTDYKLIKLVNGENIICMANEDFHDGGYEISFPLQIKTFPTMTSNGPVESCSLMRWVQPFTEEEYFHIKSDNIILAAPASPGLCAYYEKVLNHIHKDEDMEKLKNELKSIEEEIDEEIIDEELAQILENLETDTIH